ncbi:MAG: toxin-antitoxin system HicB family antitoxin [Acidobacteriota bacterium]|jgi:plasmid stability protein
MARQLTIRGVPDETANRLKQLSREREQSINATVLEILNRALGTEERRRHLERYATWTPADRAEFDAALRAQRTIDDELWR